MLPSLLLNADARAYYRDSPVEFVEDQILNGRKNADSSPVVVDAPQQEILRNLAKGLWPVVPAGRGVGKTACIAWICLWWIYVHPTAKIIVNSVKKEQLADNLWPEIRRWLYGSCLERDYCWEKTKVYVKGREETNFCVARTGADIEALQGYHDDYLLVVVEEASAIDDESFDALLGSLTGRFGHNSIAMFGNPRRMAGPFAKNIKEPGGRFTVTHIPCIDLDNNQHPRVSEGFLTYMEDRYGKDSNQYRVYVLGLLPTADDESIIPEEWVQQATQWPEDKLPHPDATYRVKWGVDVAAGGADESVITKRQGPLLLEPPLRRHSLNTMQNVAWIEDEFSKTRRENRPVAIYIDCIGVGAGVSERLAELGLPVVGVAVSRVPAVRERFRRLRDELWWRMRLWFESRAVCIPDDQILIDELIAPHYSEANGKIEVESKDKMRKRLPKIGSPDSADSLLLTFLDPDDLSEAGTGDPDDGWSTIGGLRHGETTWVSH